MEACGQPYKRYTKASRETSNPDRFFARHAGRLRLRDGLRLSMLRLYVYHTQRHGRSFGLTQIKPKGIQGRFQKKRPFLFLERNEEKTP